MSADNTRILEKLEKRIKKLEERVEWLETPIV